jgi:hypothetical protein
VRSFAVGALCVAAVWVAPPGAADDYPVADGNYTSAADPGWIYFLSPRGYGGQRDGQPVDQFGCGIGPDGIAARSERSWPRSWPASAPPEHAVTGRLVFAIGAPH